MEQVCFSDWTNPLIMLNESETYILNLFYILFSQLRTLRELYEGYVPMDYDEYLCKMSKSVNLFII